MDIKLYDKATFHEVPPAATPFSDAAYRYVRPILQEGITAFIENADVEMRLLAAGDLYLPVTVSRGSYSGTYVCSPYVHYVTYAADELIRLPHPWLRALLWPIVTCFGSILRFGNIDRAVIVNNWMLSTNLYPAVSREEIEAITKYLVEKFPSHAILWRSIQSYRQKDVVALFGSAGYVGLASRQVYLWDESHPINKVSGGRRDIREDEKLLEDGEYQYEEIKHLAPAEAEHVRYLYNLLYLDKYSRLNPQFTEHFFMHAVDSGLFAMTLVRGPGGRIDGIVGMLSLAGMATATIFGYDTRLPATTKLYRRLSMLALVYARNRHLISHASSGAASFKRNRKYVAEIEYTEAYVDHLTLRERIVWKMLRAVITMIAVPLVRRYEL